MIDVALFGAGRIGNIHAGNVAREAGVRLKYVVDVNRKPRRSSPRATARRPRRSRRCSRIAASAPC